VRFPFEFQVLKADPAIKIVPLEGVIPGKGVIDILMSYSPFEEGISCCEVQLMIKQFEFEPLPIKILGASRGKITDSYAKRPGSEKLPHLEASDKLSSGVAGLASPLNESLILIAGDKLTPPIVPALPVRVGSAKRLGDRKLPVLRPKTALSQVFEEVGKALEEGPFMPEPISTLARQQKKLFRLMDNDPTFKPRRSIVQVDDNLALISETERKAHKAHRSDRQEVTHPPVMTPDAMYRHKRMSSWQGLQRSKKLTRRNHTTLRGVSVMITL
jgi:hypothetical protein